MNRLAAVVFIVAFFSALPAWFISTLEGWVTIRCDRGSESAVTCSVHERFAFGTRDKTYGVRHAAGKTIQHPGRRSTWKEYQLVLDTVGGDRVEVLKQPVDNRETLRVAKDLDAAITAGAPSFAADLEPGGTFWITAVILVVFAASGLAIALRGS
jgi:hypothetical protein